MYATLFSLSFDKIGITKEKDMKYILILGLAFASISTTAFAGSPFGTGTGPVSGEPGGPAEFVERPGKGK